MKLLILFLLISILGCKEKKDYRLGRIITAGDISREINDKGFDCEWREEGFTVAHKYDSALYYAGKRDGLIDAYNISIKYKNQPK